MQLLVENDPHRRHAYESLTLREFFDFHVIDGNKDYVDKAVVLRKRSELETYLPQINIPGGIVSSTRAKFSVMP